MLEYRLSESKEVGSGMSILKILTWLKARDLAEIALGCAVGVLITGAVFAVIQEQVNDRMNARAIENAQYQVADALSEAHKFRASLFCAAETRVNGCHSWEPKVKP